MGIAAAVIPREWGQRLRYTRGNGDICLPNDSRSQVSIRHKTLTFDNVMTIRDYVQQCRTDITVATE